MEEKILTQGQAEVEAGKMPDLTNKQDAYATKQYRLFMTPCATLKVSGCIDCPGKVHQRYPSGKSWMWVYECGQFTQEIWTFEGTKLQHPALTHEIMMGGFHAVCGLPVFGLDHGTDGKDRTNGKGGIS